MASIFHASSSFISSSVFERSTSPRSIDAFLFPSSSSPSSFLSSTKTRNVNGRFQIRCRFNPGYRSRTGVGSSRDLQSTTVPTSVPVRVAHELLQAGHRYLDVRTPEEFSTGHVLGAINIAYMYKVGSGLTNNPEFLEEGCQLGKRSFMAATDLQSAGYTGITDISGGYSAWTQNGLPVSS